jgi:hypothetical protein
LKQKEREKERERERERETGSAALIPSADVAEVVKI